MSGFFSILRPSTILAKSAVAVPFTGSTVETALATVTIPGKAMGANGRLRIYANWSNNNSGNNKTMRIYFGGLAGTLYSTITSTTNVAYAVYREILNRNAVNAQIGQYQASASASFGANNAAQATSAIDTDADVELVFAALLANAGDSITLESYLVELLR